MIKIVINGMARSGKDTFADMCCHLGKGYQFSSVEMVKYGCELLGWDGEDKCEASRFALSEIAKIADKTFDHRKKFIREKLNVLEESGLFDYVFIHIREPELIQWAVSELHCKTVLVRNPRVPEITSNESDKNVNNFQYDYVVENRGTLAELEGEAEMYFKRMMIDNKKLERYKVWKNIL